jgi:Ca2+-transporting ATPase
MLHTGCLVRRMHACETMGAATVICTDKTGTLTQNRMQVVREHFAPSLPREALDASLALNTTAQLDFAQGAETPAVVGNPTEGALLLWLHRRGTDYRPLRRQAEVVAEEPFTTERKYMSVTVRDAEGRETRYVKGAPEIVAALCGGYAEGLKADDVADECRQWQRQALRTLGFAWQPPSSPYLIYIGIVGIADPVRPEVADAVAACRRAGIDLKMVTGDNPATALQIALQTGLCTEAEADGALMTGPQLAALTDDELQRRARGLKIIARARPLDKRRLVEALQRAGEVVAVTGDGTNDAPALKAAHVGLSMGSGTTVAKEASDITILDDSFASIVRAVLWGRSLHLNIQRFILFQMTVNVAACLIVLAGAFMGTTSPLTVTQMLWVNLIMDTFAAMALASLPPEERVMQRPPRPRRAPILSASMRRQILGVGGAFFLGLWAVLAHLERGGLTPRELSQFFTLFVGLQFWNLFNARAFHTGRSAFHFRHCPEFLVILAVIAVGQVLIVELGGELFGVVPLSGAEWARIVAATSVVLWLGEAARALLKGR